MLLTRPRRKLLFGAIIGAMAIVVIAAVMLPRSQVVYGSFLGGWPNMPAGEQNSYTFGMTEWLIVEQRRPPPVSGRPSPMERRYHIHGVRLVEALATIAIAVGVCVWAHRQLVGRFSLRRYCDECGYSVQGRASTRCPECGATGAQRPSAS